MLPTAWIKWQRTEDDLDPGEPRVPDLAYWVLNGALAALATLAAFSGWRGIALLLLLGLIGASALSALSRRGHRWAMVLVPFLLLGLVHGATLRSGTVHSVSLVGYPALISFAGLFLRRRWFVLLTIASILSWAGLTYSQIHGSLESLSPTKTSWSEFLIVALVLSALAVIVQARAAGLRQGLLAARRARSAVQTEKKRFRSLIENICEVIAVLNPDGSLQWVSQTVESVLGYTKDERWTLGVFELVHPDDLEVAKASFAKAMLRPGGHHRVEVRMLHKDGQWRSVSLSGKNLVDDPSVGGLVLSLRDISEREVMNEALEHAARRLKVAIEAANMGLWVWSIRQDRLVWQKNLDKITGAEPGAFEENRGLELVHPEDRRLVQKAIRKLFLNKDRQRVDYRLATQNGRSRWVAATARLERDSDGSPHQVVGVVQDITTHKQAELELRASEDRFAVVFNANPHPMSVSRVSDGCILDVNDSFLQAFGYQREELIGRTAADIGTWAKPDDRARLMTQIEARGSVRNEEVEFRTAAGSNRTFLISIEQIEVAGTPCLLIASTDITERKKLEVVLQESERKFFQLFQANPSPMTISDARTGEFLEGNQSMVETMGWSREELLGKSALELDIWADPRQREKVVQDLANHRTIRAREVRLRTKDGKLLTWLLSAEQIELERSRCILWSSIDITERKGLLEQLQRSQRMEAMGRLAGGVAHDFSNWLTPIIGYCDLLLATDNDDQRRAKYLQIQRAGKRAADLATQLLRFSRGEVVQKTTLNLNEVVSSAELLMRRILGSQVEFTTLLSGELLAVKADQTQIEQVLLNLTINANDAMGASGQLKLETRAVEIDTNHPIPGLELPPGQYAMMRIADSGCGMDAETLDQIFEPFFTTKEIGKGTGLGLSTVYGIVKQHDGDIVVDSAIDRGTTFQVFLPCVEKTERPDGQEAVEGAVAG